MKYKTLDDINQKECLDIGHVRQSLKALSISGGAVTIVSQVGRFVLQTISTIILARLLTPQDYGLIAMVTAVGGFISLFKDMGLSMATIQKKDITHSQVTNLFWVNLLAGVVLSLILFVAAPIVAWFYGEGELAAISRLMALSFIISSLSVQHRALLSRQMRFLDIGKIDLISMGVGIFTGIIIASWGGGYWSLVVLGMTTSFTEMILCWLICSWRPGFPNSEGKILSLVKFGGDITAFDIINYFARNLDHILVGRYWGAGNLGLYSRAYNIMMLPINQVRSPLNNVAIPALSQIYEDDGRFRNYYLKLINIIAFITMPLMVFLFVWSDQVIYFVLGGKWIEANSIFKILCVTGFIQPVSTTWGLVLVSLGRTRRYVKWGILNSAFIGLSFIVGLHWGPIGVAAGYTAATYLLLIPTLGFCLRETSISLLDFFSQIRWPLIASIIMGIIMLFLRKYLLDIAFPIGLFVSFALGLFVYIIIIRVLPGGEKSLRRIYSYRAFFLARGYLDTNTKIGRGKGI